MRLTIRSESFDISRRPRWRRKLKDPTENISWEEVWNVVKGSDKVARRRALRETATVLSVALIPLLLGAFFVYVTKTRAAHSSPSYFELAQRATLAGQLFLLFLSLVGTIFARLWDSDGPQYAFSSTLNVICLIGTVIASGLLAIDTDMKSFSFWPVGFTSVLFFLIGLIYYFILAIPAYLQRPDLQGNMNEQSDKLGRSLEQRMGEIDA